MQQPSTTATPTFFKPLVEETNRIAEYEKLNGSDLFNTVKQNENDIILVLNTPALAAKIPSITLINLGKKYDKAAQAVLASDNIINKIKETLNYMKYFVLMCKPHAGATLALLQHETLKTELNSEQLIDFANKYATAAEYIMNDAMLSSKIDSVTLENLKAQYSSSTRLGM